jgi:hypothetical protein
MSAEIVNLKRYRKAIARREREAEAAENRHKHGQSKAERQQQAAESGLAKRRLDWARRERKDEDEAPRSDAGPEED